MKSTIAFKTQRRLFITSLALSALGVLAPMLPTDARAEGGEVVYYGYGGDHLAPTIKAFNAIHPNIKVKVVTMEGGALEARLIAESSRPQSDVTYISADILINHPELFQPFKSQYHDSFPEWGIVRNGDDILGYGYNISIQIFGVNTSKMKLEDAPKSWEDLTKPEFKGKFIAASPSLTTAGYDSFSQIVQMFGWDKAQKYVENGKFLATTGAIPQSIARGEEAFGIFEETKVWGLQNDGYPVKVIYPKEGVAPTVQTISLIKNGPNPENAKLFAEFMNSKEGHEITVKARNRRTPRVDAPAPSGVPANDTLVVNKQFNYFEGVKKHDEWVGKFSAILQAKSN